MRSTHRTPALEGACTLARGARAAARAGGFTLLEVTMSAAVLIIVAMSSLLVMVPVSRQSRISREVEAGVVAVREVLEEIQLTPFDELTAAFPPGFEVAVPELAQGSIAVAYEDPAADSLVAHVTLSWQSPDLGPMSRMFVASRTR